MNLSQAAFEVAGGMMGLKEWPGARHNPAILGMWDDIGLGGVNDDETPWCAAFVGSVLATIGLQGTGKPDARSYLKWGVEAVGDPQPGDVCVFWRVKREGWRGHVGFFVKSDGANIVVRGGNQGNRVSDAKYPTHRLLAVRRAPSRKKTPKAVSRPASGGLAALFAALVAAIRAFFERNAK